MVRPEESPMQWIGDNSKHISIVINSGVRVNKQKG